MDMNSKTNEELLAEIDNRNTAIEAEAEKGDATDHNQVIQWRNEISLIQMTLSDRKTVEAQQQDAQVQQQAQVAQTDGLKETIRSIRDAVYLKELMDRALGITENATATQDFNSMVDQAVDEDQTALYAAFNTQLEQRDEKYRALTSQALDVQNQLDKANVNVSVLSEINNNQSEIIDNITKDRFQMQQIIDGHDEELHQKDIEISRLEKLLEEEKSHTFDLQKALNDAPAPKPAIDITPTAPSESLADKIAQAKVASIKQFSNLYSDVTYTDGTKEVVHNSQIPSLPIPGLPTAIAVANQNVEQSADTQANAVNHFPSDNVQATDSGTDQTADRNATQDTVVEQNTAAEETLTLDSLKAEIDALKTAHGERLDRLDKQANLPAVA